MAQEAIDRLSGRAAATRNRSAASEPVHLSLDQRRLLAEKARGIDPEILKQISVFDPEELKAWDSETDSIKNP